MHTETEGIVLKNIKIVNGRRMLVLFSKKYGKISVGTGISEKAKNKSALAMNPFTLGRYELFKSRENFNVNTAETIRSFYALGEDIDKYMYASYALEFIDKLLVEGKPAPKIFEILVEFLDALESRSKSYETLIISLLIKCINVMGIMPNLEKCVYCNKNNDAIGFSVAESGIICSECINNIAIDNNVSLIFKVNFGIVEIMKFFMKASMKSLEKVALEPHIQNSLEKMLKSYCKYHLDIGELKSESFFKRY